jgi:hypothetical protein
MFEKLSEVPFSAACLTVFSLSRYLLSAFCASCTM